MGKLYYNRESNLCSKLLAIRLADECMTELSDDDPYFNDEAQRMLEGIIYQALLHSAENSEGKAASSGFTNA